MKTIDKTMDTYLHSLEAIKAKQKELDKQKEKLDKEYKHVLSKIDWRR